MMLLWGIFCHRMKYDSSAKLIWNFVLRTEVSGFRSSSLFTNRKGWRRNYFGLLIFYRKINCMHCAKRCTMPPLEILNIVFWLRTFNLTFIYIFTLHLVVCFSFTRLFYDACLEVMYFLVLNALNFFQTAPVKYLSIFKLNVARFSK